MAYLGEPKVIKGVCIREKGGRKRRVREDMRREADTRVMRLPDEDQHWGMQAARRGSWNDQMDSFLVFPEGMWCC